MGPARRRNTSTCFGLCVLGKRKPGSAGCFGKEKPGSAGRLRTDGGRPLRYGGSCHHWGKALEKM